jgi:hypothetical protein
MSMPILVHVLGCAEAHTEQMTGDGSGESRWAADKAGRAFLAVNASPHDDKQGDQDKEHNDRCES